MYARDGQISGSGAVWADLHGSQSVRLLRRRDTQRGPPTMGSITVLTSDIYAVGSP